MVVLGCPHANFQPEFGTFRLHPPVKNKLAPRLLRPCTGRRHSNFAIHDIINLVRDFGRPVPINLRGTVSASFPEYFPSSLYERNLL